MERFNQLKSLVDSFEKDFEKFYVKDNKAAGVRVRKQMQELRQLAQEIRGEVQERKRAEDESAAAGGGAASGGSASAGGGSNG